MNKECDTKDFLATHHQTIVGNSNHLQALQDQSVHLVVTSPPYPMIEMWDEIFSKQDASIREALSQERASVAFEKMHLILDKTWEECDRVLKNGGFICVNIGDATRTISGKFQLFSNHSRVIQKFVSMGYSVLPDVLWRKPSNSPNKFMGSGMYPAGAYITLEHEYILVFRKGPKRDFSPEERTKRQQSAFFWEERNLWFSDCWEIRGAAQSIKGSLSRERNASFPFEIPFRLVNMYSIAGDVVLDPFAGLGTTALACAACGRNSYSVEIDPTFAEAISILAATKFAEMGKRQEQRLEDHGAFIKSLPEEKKAACYLNSTYNILVKTKQEKDLWFPKMTGMSNEKLSFTCWYE